MRYEEHIENRTIKERAEVIRETAIKKKTKEEWKLQNVLVWKIQRKLNGFVWNLKDDREGDGVETFWTNEMR